jgi:hypothetical protein
MGSSYKAVPVDLTIHRVDAAGFCPAAGIITFEDRTVGDTNPVYTPTQYSAVAPSPTVRFGRLLQGMSLTNIFDAEGIGYFKGTPDNPLVLVTSGSPVPTVKTDPARGSVGGRNVVANGDDNDSPFVMFFDTNVTAVAFNIGGINVSDGIRIRAVGRDGTMLGEWFSEATLPAFEWFYLRRAGTDTANIAAILIEVKTGFEDAGVAIKNIMFGHTKVGTPTCVDQAMRVGNDLFVDGPGLITFYEQSTATINPVYTRAGYGGTQSWEPAIVEFGAMFYFQSLISPNWTPDTSIDYPVTLDLDAYYSFITTDGTRPTGEQRCLSGISFGFPQAMVFSAPVVGVSMNVGYCNVVGGVTVRAINEDGAILGEWKNWQVGYENFNIVTTGGATIKAIQLFCNVSLDPTGFSMSRVKFTNTPI